MNLGCFYIICASTIWGLLPIYLKWLSHIPTTQLTGYRIVWSCFILLLVMLVTRQWQKFYSAISKLHVLRYHFIAAVLLGINWLVFTWATNANFIVEASLGYYIDPLVTIVIGTIFFQEQMRPWQWISVGVAACGVLVLSFVCGSFPWISLILALTFGTYGSIKKLAPLDPFYGLTLEIMLLFLPAISYLIYIGSFKPVVGSTHTDLISKVLLTNIGIVNTVPLLMFAAAAKRISLFLLGFLQYITPTLQFLLGVFVYQEPFSHHQLIGFSIIWIALAIFVFESLIYKHSCSKFFR